MQILSSGKGPSRRTLSIKHVLLSGLCASFFVPASGMDLKTALELTLNTNPEIGEAAANRRAIDFEYEQAKRLNSPAVIVEGRVGPEWWRSRTTRLLGNDDDVLFGRQASVTMQQNLMSFGRHEAEREYQSSRSDGAAHRVHERSLFKALDATQAYIDILRLREILGKADQHIAYLETKVADLDRSSQSGVGSAADTQQARERLSAGIIDRNETEEALILAENTFYQVVGQEIGQTVMPAAMTGKIPGSLAEAIGIARRNNPTLSIARADLDAARAEFRKAKSDTRPKLDFELTGRAGDHINGFRDDAEDVRAQLVFRYEFRGGIKSSAEQELLNRADEVRQRIMSLERNVDNIVRESWASKNKTQERYARLQTQVSEGATLLSSYEREFSVGRRTINDILNAENAKFQAESAMITAKYADLYARYRILAATGTLLDDMGLTVRREGVANMRKFEGVVETPIAETEKRRNPTFYKKIYMGEGLDGRFEVAEETTTESDTKKTVSISPVIKYSTIDTGEIERYKPKAAPVKTAAVEPPAPAMAAAVEALAAPVSPVTEPATISTGTIEFIDPEPQLSAEISTPEISETKSLHNQSPETEIARGADTYKAYLSPQAVSPAPRIITSTVELSETISPSETVAATDPMDVSGYSVQSVSEEEFKRIKIRPGAEVNWAFKSIKHEGVLYLLDDTL